jgi:aspartyl/asparaginyl-tRNA synthetase
MKDLLKISLIISLIGIFLLLFLSSFLTISQIDIERINNKLLNEKVRVQGIIFNVRSYEDSNFQIISIKDETGKIDVTTDKITGLKNDDQIIVTGTVKEYNQYLQINADKIILMD